MTSQIDTLGGELIDLITERVAEPPHPAERAEVVLALVSCALDAVRWRLEPAGDPVEEGGLDAVAAAARAHLDAMRDGGPVLRLVSES